MFKRLTKTIWICALLLPLSIAAQTSWTGAISSDWNDAGNWTGGVPTSSVDAIVGDSNFTGANQPALTVDANCKSLTIGGATTAVLTVDTPSLFISGDLMIATNGTLEHSFSSIVWLTGNWVNNGSYNPTHVRALVVFAGTSQTITGTSVTAFKRIRVDTSSTVKLATNIDVSNPGGLLEVYGTFDPSEAPGYRVQGNGRIRLKAGGVLIVTAPTFTGNYGGSLTVDPTATIDYAATTVNQIVTTNGITYGNLRISGGMTKTLEGALTLSSLLSSYGNVYVDGGTLNTATFPLTRANTAGGQISIANGATLKIGGTSSFPTNFATHVLGEASTVEYAGANQTVAAENYGNLSLSGSAGAVIKTMPATALTIRGNLTAAAGGASSVSFTAANAITVNGDVSLGSGTIFNGAGFSHTFAGNWINNGTYNGSTGSVTLSGIDAGFSGTGVNNFNNLTVTGAGLTAANNTSLTVAGNFATSGAGTFTHLPGASGALTMSGTTKTISGTGISLNDLTVSGTVTTSSSLTIAGNLAVSGSFAASSSTTTFTGTLKTISGAGALTLNNVTVTGSISTARSFSINGNLSVSGALTATAGTVTFSGTSTLSGTANLFNVTLNGTRLQLGSSSTLGVAGALTLTAGTFDVTTTTPNTVNYNGAGAQTVLGGTYHNLSASGGGTKTVAAALTVNGDLAINSGPTLSAGTFTHSVYGNFQNSGTFVPGTGTVRLLGGNDTYIAGTTTFNILTLNKSTAVNTVTLSNNVNVATVNMTTGKMLTGTNAITISTTRTGGGIILGTITRTHSFSAGTAYAFEGTNNTVTFSALGSVSSVTVRVEVGPVTDFPANSSVNRQYTINLTSSGAYTATLRLHYEDSELNGNAENGMGLWRNAGLWAVSGKTANNSTNNWAEHNLITNITGRWSLSVVPDIAQWNGTVSTAWENPLNWTVAQGLPTLPPSTNDIAQLGTLEHLFQPTISSAVSIKAVSFGSAKATTLTLGSGGSLSTIGNIGGIWSTNATHEIQVGTRTLNVGGDLVLSDGTNAHAINLSVDSGSVTVTNSISQAGGATVAFTGAGALNIGGNYNLNSGTFSAGASTVTYNGSAAQVVAGVTYNDLSFNKTGGTATLSTPATVNGDVTLSTGGTFLVNSALAASNVTINTGATLNGGSSTISVSGNWTRNGTFTPNTGTMVFNGSEAQSIGSSTFNNLTVNKSAGTAILSGNLTLNGNLAISSGTLDLATFTANRSTTGGTLSMDADGILKITGANNFPANYAVRTIDAASTVEYNGTIAQTISAQTYGHLLLSNGGTNAKTLAGATTVAGDIVINSGARFAASSFALTAQGNWTNNGTFVAGTSTIALSGSGKNLSGATTFNHLNVSGNYTAADGITVNGNTTISGSYAAGTTTNSFAGAFSNSGSFTSSGVVTFNGATAQSIALNSGFVSTGTVNFNGTVAPTFLGTTAPTFHNVNINNTAGVAPTAGWQVNGIFAVSAGARFSGGGSTHVFNGTFNNTGNVTSSGTLVFNPNTATTVTLRGTSFSSTGTVILGGTGQITLAGTTPTFNNVTITNTHGAGVTPNLAWIVPGNLVIASGSTFNASGFTHTFSKDFANNGTFNGNTSTVVMNGTTSISGGGTTTFNNLTVSSIVTNSANIYVTGNFANNGTFDSSSFTVTFTGSTASTISGSTTPTPFGHLTIAKTGASTALGINLSSVIALSISSGTLDAGSFTISQDSTGGTLNVAADGTLKIGGGNTLPTFTSYTFNPASTVEYAGNSSQTIAAQNYGNLTSSGTGARTLASSGTIGIAGAFTPGSNTYTVTGSTINYNGSGAQTIAAFNYNHLTSSSTGARTLAASGTIGVAGTFTPGTSAYTAVGSTINFNGGAQTVPAFTFHNLTTSGSGTKTLGGNINVNNALALGAVGFADAGFTATVNGNVSNATTHTGPGKITLSGGSVEHLLSGSGAYQNLELNDNNGAALNLTNLTVNGALTLATGKIVTSTNKVIVNASGNVVRTDGHIIGNLQKNVSTGANIAQTFEVGTTNGYEPVTLTFSNVTASGTIVVRANNDDHGSIATATLDPTKSVNVNWTLTNATLAFNNCRASFTFEDPSDLDAGVDAAFLKAARFLTNTWTYPAISQRLSGMIEVSGLTNFGEFQLAYPINRRPTVSAISDVTMNEDSTVALPVGGIGPGATDESWQTLTLTATSSDPSIVPDPAIDYTSPNTNATVTITPGANAFGSATITVVVRDDGGTANSGIDAVTNTFTVTVNSVNDVPGFVKGADQTITEDAGAQTVSGWATSISNGPASESAQVMTFAITNDNNALFTVQPAVSLDGTLTYTPATNIYGSATVSLALSDDGGTANGGSDTSAAQTFQITVLPVNDPPTFVKGTNISVYADEPQTITNWATSISPGPNEPGQTLGFEVTNDDTTLFDVQPALASDGTLTFQAKADATGAAAVTVVLRDNGGTANGGVDFSTQNFTIYIGTTNHTPSFTKGADVTVLEDAGAQTIANWATDISPGPDEVAQQVDFIVTNDNATLFTAEPAIASNGALTYTPAVNAYGTATVTVRIHDDGGTLNGGIDTSAPQTFTITITGINDVPSFVKGADQIVPAASRQRTITNWASAMTAGPANESAQTLTFALTNDTPAAFLQQPAISANGTLTFEVSPLVENLLATVSVRIVDDGGTSNGGVDTSAEQTFRIFLSTSYTGYTLTDLSPGSTPTGMWLGNLRGLSTWRDLITANYSNSTITVRLCRDNGTFGFPTDYAVGLNPIAVRSGDLNQDAYEDVISANFGTNTVSVLINRSKGLLYPAVDYVVGSTPNPGPIAVTAGDANRDGRVDLLVANFNENTISVLRNVGNGIFTAPANYAVGNGPSSIVLSDITGDGLRDVLTANKTDGTLTILRGNNDGTFSSNSTVTLFAGGDPQPVRAVPIDLDGDGLMDLVTANANSNSVTVLTGNTNGSFSVLTNYAVGSRPSAMLVRDLNHDAIPDLLIANSGSASLQVLLGNGDGTFEYGHVLAVGSNPTAVVGSNLDNDNATDIVVSNSGDDTISVLRYAGPLAYNQRLNVHEDTAVSIPLNGRALGTTASALTYIVLDAPAHGTLSGPATNLVYTPDQDYFGADSFRYQVMMQVAGVTLESSVARVSLNVISRNDAPTFTLSTNLIVVMEDGPFTTIANVVRDMSPGPANETNQAVTFLVDANRNYFKVLPAISSMGTLSFQPAMNVVRDIPVTVRLRDNGGFVAGETNTSVSQTFTIRVVANPVKAVAGMYNGLFYETNEVAHERSGHFTFTMKPTRYYSGKMSTKGSVYSFAGQFDNSGTATASIPRFGLPSLTVQFQLNVSGADQVTGTVSDGSWTAMLLGDRLRFHSTTNVAPQKGKYTFSLSNNGSAGSPPGSGYGTISIDGGGKLRASGMLADGTSFAQSTCISKTGVWPFYASAYTGKGSVLGWITFTNRAASSVEGLANWIKTSAAGGQFYSAGFTNQPLLSGSTFVAAGTGVRILNLTNGTAIFSGGNLLQPFTNTFILQTNNVFLTSGTPAPTLNANKYGLLSGSFLHPVTRKTSVIRGVILQQSASGAGFFLGTNQAGAVIIE